jgi:spermidine synthase
VVGFGAGITAGTFVIQPGIERVVICEIEPLTTRAVAGYFKDANYDILDDPRVEVVHDDARHFLLTTHERFDIITSDPIHPWVKGGAALYTKEYFDLARAHLNPGGVITQWVPLYESTVPVVKSEIGTFVAAFPGATLWSSHRVGPGFDMVMAARPDGLVIDVEQLERRLASPAYARVMASLATVGIGSVDDLLAMYSTRGSDLTDWLSDAQINRDTNLRLMYLAGLGVNVQRANDIHNEIQRYRTFPDDLIVGPPDRIRKLRRSMGTEIT